MRLLSYVFAPASVGLLCVTLAHAAKTYEDKVEGFQSASREGIALHLGASGDLPGEYKTVLRRDGKNVTGGSWTLTVFAPDADAVSGAKGELTGSVTGGALTFNGEGAVAGANSVQLTVHGGTGQYVGIKSGRGALNLSTTPENPSQLAGTLTLDF